MVSSAKLISLTNKSGLFAVFEINECWYRKSKIEKSNKPKPVPSVKSEFEYKHGKPVALQPQGNEPYDEQDFHRSESQELG